MHVLFQKDLAGNARAGKLRRDHIRYLCVAHVNPFRAVSPVAPRPSNGRVAVNKKSSAFVLAGKTSIFATRL